MEARGNESGAVVWGDAWGVRQAARRTSGSSSASAMLGKGAGCVGRGPCASAVVPVQIQGAKPVQNEARSARWTEVRVSGGVFGF